jgi:hypothetical protein
MKKVDVREALIDLIVSADISLFGTDKCYAEVYADHLIANGVTLNVCDCHWATEQAYKNGYKQGKQDAVEAAHGRCDYCKDGKSFIRQTTMYGNDGLWHRINYWPNCGAEMDGQETKSSGISQRTVQALERMGQKVHGGEDGK